MSRCNLPTALIPISFDELPDEDADESSGLRTRVERVARDYLNGRGIFILSASLKGPLDHNWRNPWATKCLKNRESLTKPLENGGKSAKIESTQRTEREVERSPLKPLPLNVRCLSQTFEGEYFGETDPGRAPHAVLDSTPDITHENNNNISPLSDFAAAEKPCRSLKSITHWQTIDDPSHMDVLEPNSVNSEPEEPQVMQHTMSNVPCSNCGQSFPGSIHNQRKSKTGTAVRCDGCGGTFESGLKKPRLSYELEDLDATGNSVSSTHGTQIASKLTEHERVANVLDHNRTEQKRSVSATLPNASHFQSNGLKYLSQPELAARSSRNDSASTLDKTDSFPRGTDRKVLSQTSIMARMWPGGLMTEVFNTYAELISLLGDQAESRLQNILKLGPSTNLSNAIGQKDLDPANMKRRRARSSSKESEFVPDYPTNKTRATTKRLEMTFDTPVVTRPRRRTRQQVGGPKTVMESAIQASLTPGSKEGLTIQNKDELQLQVPSELQGHFVPDRNEQYLDSPQMSTQAALQEANIAFQNCIDTPVKPVIDLSNRISSDIPTCTSAYKVPTSSDVVRLAQTSFTTNDKRDTVSQANKTLEINTQALFDAYESPHLLPQTPLHSHPSSLRKRKTTRFSLTQDENTDPTVTMPVTPLIHQGSSAVQNKNNLRKSALKISALARCTNSSDGITKDWSFGDISMLDSDVVSRGESQTEQTIADENAKAEGHGADGTTVSLGDTEEFDLEAFMQQISEDLAV